MRINDEVGYVLKKQDYGDTSLLVDVFTREHGRLRVVVKGARTGKAAKARILQPFSHLSLGWSGRSELKTLTQLELLQTFHLGKEPLVCGFYLNELLWNFLEVFDPHEMLFDQYEATLSALSEECFVEPLLRKFEFFLLQDIGYGVCFDLDADTGAPLDSKSNYLFELEKGLVCTSNTNEGYPGELYLAIANEEYSNKAVLMLAKNLSRKVIYHRLNGQELNSRKWFANMRSANA